MYNSKTHNSDDNDPNEDLPTFVKFFFDYFTWKDEQNTASNAMQQRQQIGRSLVGQQPALGNNDDENVVLLGTTATPGRVSGSGDVASNIEMITTQPSTVSNTNGNNDNVDSSLSLESSVLNTPRRRLSSASRSNERSATRQRRSNRDYGFTNDPMLPPSTSQRRGFNISQMISGFDNVARSLDILAQSNRFRRVIDIHNDIIETIDKRDALENRGVRSGNMWEALSNKIEHLDVELEQAQSFDRDLRSNDESTNDDN